MKTRKRNRLMALVLCMMLTMLPMAGTVSAAGLPDPQGSQQTQEEMQPTKAAQAEEKQQTAKIITAVNALKGDAARLTAPAGTKQSGLSLPDGLTGTIDGKEDTSFPVTWGCKDFDENTPGEYMFTASPGEGYMLSDEVVLPVVTVAVKAAGAPYMLRGAVNPSLYKIDNRDDWNGLQTWLTNTAITGAVVKINITDGYSNEINIPNKDITIEGPANGTVDVLHLKSTEAVTLTIKDLKMSFEKNGINLASGSTLEFAGDNALTATINAEDFAAIHVPKGSTLTLAGAGSSPSLEITASAFGAGIGGNLSNASGGGDSGHVNIQGGNITVKPLPGDPFGSLGAGIGGGGAGKDTDGGNGGMITISNATVTVSSHFGAAIGGGLGHNRGGNGGVVIIDNATVTASSTTGAAIGGGEGENIIGGSGGNITIRNSKVTATSVGGAGIGGSWSENAIGGDGGNVNILGSEVTASSGNGAGIGGGSSNSTGGKGGVVTISNAAVTAISEDAYDIGGAKGLAGGTLTIDSTGSNLATLDMQKNGTNAAMDHSIGTCEIKDATGTLTGIYSRLTVTNGTAGTAHPQKDFWKAGIFKSGATVSLTADTPQQGKYFSGWTASPALAFADADKASTTFTMPGNAQTVTANYGQAATDSSAGGRPATGDTSQVWPWVLLMLAALAGGVLVIVRKRRR